METKDITLEKLITIWKIACTKMHLPIDSYEAWPNYSIKITSQVTLSLSNEETPCIRLLFGGYLSYKKFSISEELFDELSDDLEQSINDKNEKVKEELILQGKNQLEYILALTKE